MVTTMNPMNQGLENNSIVCSFFEMGCLGQIKAGTDRRELKRAQRRMVNVIVVLEGGLVLGNQGVIGKMRRDELLTLHILIYLEP
jgi:hypothetical protein